MAIFLHDVQRAQRGNCDACLRIGKMLASASFHAGTFFEPEITGLTSHLKDLLHLQGYQHIQTKTVASIVRAVTSIGKDGQAHATHSLPAMRPFIQKWSGANIQEYDRLCQQVLAEAPEDANFYTQTNFLTVWGSKGASSSENQTF